MLMSGAATQAEPLEKESRSKEDKMITWEILVPLVHLDYVTFVLRFSLPRTVFSD